jgi:hypothetical protein
MARRYEIRRKLQRPSAVPACPQRLLFSSLRSSQLAWCLGGLLGAALPLPPAQVCHLGSVRMWADGAPSNLRCATSGATVRCLWRRLAGWHSYGRPHVCGHRYCQRATSTIHGALIFTGGRADEPAPGRLSQAGYIYKRSNTRRAKPDGRETKHQRPIARCEPGGSCPDAIRVSVWGQSSAWLLGWRSPAGLNRANGAGSSGNDSADE